MSSAVCAQNIVTVRGSCASATGCLRSLCSLQFSCVGAQPRRISTLLADNRLSDVVIAPSDQSRSVDPIVQRSTVTCRRTRRGLWASGAPARPPLPAPARVAAGTPSAHAPADAPPASSDWSARQAARVMVDSAMTASSYASTAHLPWLPPGFGFLWVGPRVGWGRPSPGLSHAMGEGHVGSSAKVRQVLVDEFLDRLPHRRHQHSFAGRSHELHQHRIRRAPLPRHLQNRRHARSSHRTLATPKLPGIEIIPPQPRPRRHRWIVLRVPHLGEARPRRLQPRARSAASAGRRAAVTAAAQ